MDREDYLEATLNSLSGLSGLSNLTVYVSQDGTHPGVASLVSRLGNSRFRPPTAHAFEHWQHPREALLSTDQVNMPANAFKMYL
jgi:hypothetical protein